MNIRQLGTLLRARQASCVELVNQAVSAARKLDHLRAFITVTESEARAAAAVLDQEFHNGIDRGPLHGIPIVLKDLLYTEGIRTTAGSRIFENFVPEHDARVVTGLRAAGAISIGKTNLHEMAFGITSRNPHFGHVLNPLDITRLAGGSSGGTATAIASGMVSMGLGTDTGGSIRIPASYCGIVGLKPTYGLVSRHGVVPLAFSLDHVGPLGSCVEDCALAMNVMGEGDYNLPLLDDLKGVRVGVPANFFFDRLDEEVADAVRHSASEMERAGAQVNEIRVPDFNEINLTSHIIILSEFAALHSERHKPREFGDDVWELLQLGRRIAAHEYVNAQRLRTLFRREMDAVWRQIDVLVTPTTPIVAPPAEHEMVQVSGQEENVRMASTRLVRGFNLLGDPALSMPCGRNAEGLPIGLQLVSAPFYDAELLQIAKTLEQRLGTFQRQA